MTLAKKDIEKRVRNWVSRLDSLFDQIALWSKNFPDIKILRDSIPQAVEPLMKQFKIQPQKVPILTLLKNSGRVRIAFVPSAIWIGGANGRINIAINRHQLMLVDMGNTTSNQSNWCLVFPSDRKVLIPFDRNAFLELLRTAK